MRAYWCERCLDYCPRRRSSKVRGGIQELWETITHKNGSKESFRYGQIEVATQRILEMKLI
jgi:hypothetical protein